MANNPAVHSLNVVLKVKSSQHRPGCSVRQSCGGRPQAIDQPVCCELPIYTALISIRGKPWWPYGAVCIGRYVKALVNIYILVKSHDEVSTRDTESHKAWKNQHSTNLKCIVKLASGFQLVSFHWEQQTVFFERQDHKLDRMNAMSKFTKYSMGISEFDNESSTFIAAITKVW